MTIPLLEYSPSSQNQRVSNYEIPGDEQSWIYTTENLPSASEIQTLIWAAYRQIFNEQQLISSNRDKALESQLKAGQITVREFIRGLLLSDSFRRRNYEPNSNYRFAEMCVQRVLGRNVYSDREKMAWSISIATKGLEGFVDEFLNSEEYLNYAMNNRNEWEKRGQEVVAELVEMVEAKNEVDAKKRGGGGDALRRNRSVQFEEQLRVEM